MESNLGSAPTESEPTETNAPPPPTKEKTEKCEHGDKLLNESGTIINDYLTGVVSSNHFVGKMHYGNVIIRRDYESISQVMIVSGCASGREPAFSGFVGKGMLTASIHGDLFVEPSAKCIIRTIKELHNSKGNEVLIIIPSSQAECYTFGLAYQRAINEAIKVKLLCVSDDVIIKPKDRIGGLSGVLLIQKIAGAMSELGKRIGEISNYCSNVVKDMRSVLLCLHPETNYTRDNCSCKRQIIGQTMEIGVGLMGVTRGLQMPMKSASDTAKLLIAELTNPNSPKRLILQENIPVVLLLNNLGTMSELEQGILTKELINEIYNCNVQVARVYSGRYYTSQLLRGFTVTLFNVKDENVLEYLDFPTNAPSWQTSKQVLDKTQLQCIIGKIIPTPRLAMIKGPLISTRHANIILLVVQFACDALISCERQLNIMDTEASDGDTGTRLKLAATDILQLLREKQFNLEYPFTFLMALSKVLEGIGGMTGCLYSVMFEAAANSFCNLPETHIVQPTDWFNCLQLALNAILSFSTVVVGDKTLIDPIAACFNSIEKALSEEPIMGYVAVFGEGVAAAEQCAQRTKHPQHRFPDAGAHAVGIWLRACYEGVKMRCEN